MERNNGSTEYKGIQYPNHYIFHNIESPQEGQIVGETIPIVLGGYKKGNHIYPANYLVWTQDTILEMSASRYEEWKNK